MLSPSKQETAVALGIDVGGSSVKLGIVRTDGRRPTPWRRCRLQSTTKFSGILFRTRPEERKEANSECTGKGFKGCKCWLWYPGNV